MPTTFTNTNSGETASSEALKHKEGDAVKKSVDSVADDSATRAGDRMKKNEKDQLFTK